MLYPTCNSCGHYDPNEEFCEERRESVPFNEDACENFESESEKKKRIEEMRKALEFVEYTGRYPNLCSGRLFVRINGVLISFGNYCLGEKGKTSDEGVQNYPEFWHTGGHLNRNYDAVQYPWRLSDWIKEKQFPPEIRKFLPMLIDLFNENVPYGCCGGCA